jgi:hypothetical protein
MKNKYKNLYNQMHDVAVNKISLTNPNIDVDKWYEGFKEDYEGIYSLLDQSLLDKRLMYYELKNNNDFIPQLIEIKILLKNSNLDSSYLDSINSLFEYIKKEDLNLFNEINTIEKSYTQIFEGLK